MADAKSYSPQRKGVAMPKSDYRADVIGCYAMWSPTLHDAHRRKFPSQDHTIIKIGKSEDIFGRIDNHNGIDSKFSILNWANDRDGYAHVKDWKLWRITTQLNGMTLRRRELQLQDAHVRVADFVWEDIHRKVSDRKYIPAVEELFVCRIATVAGQFGMPIMPIAELGDG
ncbi:hypothetical protein [Sphingomonas sanguinis]|uniref:hypothetical protein n=1 Tax=Sphingomonas sanguinis TaxID=33051 RepID=UPI00128EBD6F|nr:hypothetical protein [Sphingomonas sanguinis]